MRSRFKLDVIVSDYLIEDVEYVLQETIKYFYLTICANYKQNF